MSKSELNGKHGGEGKLNKTVLCIIDGLGINRGDFGNAVKAAGMKNLDAAIANFPSAEINASGLEVGLADTKDPGNSEVGHNAIGSGQRIKQGLALLNEKFESGDIFAGETWKRLVENARKSKLNIFTLISDGRLHSDMYAHLFPMLKKCAEEKIKVAIHGLVDGRDVPTQSAVKYINDIRACIKECGVTARLATAAGRSVLVMDRYETDTRLLANTVEVCVRGKAPVVSDIEAAINAEYAKRPDMTDESMPAFVLEPEWLLKNGDSVLLLNYRGDRAVELCNMFERGKYLDKAQYAEIDRCLFAGVLQYDAELELPRVYLCPPPSIKNGLSEWLCSKGVRQLSVTETVKYGHLTYFFNGNRAAPFDAELEQWKEFKSDVCGNMYNGAPKMQAGKICDAVCSEIARDNFDFIKLNFPNPDMVGHTGDFEATVTACSVVDNELSKIIEHCKRFKANLIITADHGNAEFMKYEDGKPRSSHTNSLVPFVVMPFGHCGKDCGMGHSCNKVKIKDAAKKGKFGLTNIAAAVCELLGVPVSPHFNESVIEL